MRTVCLLLYLTLGTIEDSGCCYRRAYLPFLPLITTIITSTVTHCNATMFEFGQSHVFVIIDETERTHGHGRNANVHRPPAAAPPSPIMMDADDGTDECDSVPGYSFPFGSAAMTSLERTHRLLTRTASAGSGMHLGSYGCELLGLQQPRKCSLDSVALQTLSRRLPAASAVSAADRGGMGLSTSEQPAADASLAALQRLNFRRSR
jgi:hypothetical protein